MQWFGRSFMDVTPFCLGRIGFGPYEVQVQFRLVGELNGGRYDQPLFASGFDLDVVGKNGRARQILKHDVVSSPIEFQVSFAPGAVRSPDRVPLAGPDVNGAKAVQPAEFPRVVAVPQDESLWRV
jgi:hypothetical protein